MIINNKIINTNKNKYWWKVKLKWNKISLIHKICSINVFSQISKILAKNKNRKNSFSVHKKIVNYLYHNFVHLIIDYENLISFNRFHISYGFWGAHEVKLSGTFCISQEILQET